MPVLSKRFESENRNSFLIRFSKSVSLDKPESAWRSLYTFDREPVGRGFAGKVYKIFPKCKDSLENIDSKLDGYYFSDSGDSTAARYYACKAIRRWRCGKDTIHRISRELKAMYKLQSSIDERICILRNQDSDFIRDVIDMGRKFSRIPSPPTSAAPKLLSVHEDSREVAIIMEFANGGSLYDLCKSKYDPLIRSPAANTGYHSFTMFRPTHGSNASQHCPPFGDAPLPIGCGPGSTRRSSEPSKASEFGLPETYVIQVMRRLLLAVSYMHQHLQMVHLDIKAENVLLRQCYPSTDVFLTDFGLATELSENKEHRELAGTPDYAAPEIINYDPITFATDMWSVGVLTYYLLTGVSPFLADEKEITMQNVTHGPINYPEELFADRSTEALNFLKALLVRKPSDRLSAEQCLQHPWLQTPCDGNCDELASEAALDVVVDSSKTLDNVYTSTVQICNVNDTQLIPATYNNPFVLESKSRPLSTLMETVPEQNLLQQSLEYGEFTKMVLCSISRTEAGVSESNRLCISAKIQIDERCFKLFQMLQDIRHQIQPITNYNRLQLTIDQAPWFKSHHHLASDQLKAVSRIAEANETTLCAAAPICSQVSRVIAHASVPTVRRNQMHCVEIHVELIAPSVAKMAENIEHSCSALIYLTGCEYSTFDRTSYSPFQGLDSGNRHLRNYFIHPLSNTMSGMCAISMDCLYLASLTRPSSFSSLSVFRTASIKKSDHCKLTARALGWNTKQPTATDNQPGAPTDGPNSKIRGNNTFNRVIRSLRDSFDRAVRIMSSRSTWSWSRLRRPRSTSV